MEGEGERGVEAGGEGRGKGRGGGRKGEGRGEVVRVLLPVILDTTFIICTVKWPVKFLSISVATCNNKKRQNTVHILNTV